MAADDVQRRIRAVYESHGERPPPTTALSNLLAAGTARRGTRTVRLLWLAIRAIARSVRWSWQPTPGLSAGTPGSVDHNRAQLRDSYRGVGILAVAGVSLTALACWSTGRRRLLFATGAAASVAIAAWGALLLSGIAQFLRFVESRPGGSGAATPRGRM